MDAKQFAWVYLLENGIAGFERSYYGGLELIDKRLTPMVKHTFLDMDDLDASKDFYLKEIKEYGINWDKTVAPISNMISEFVDSFSDAKETEYLKGTLVLANGAKQYWTAEKLEISNIFDMMASIDEFKEKAVKLGIIG